MRVSFIERTGRASRADLMIRLSFQSDTSGERMTGWGAGGGFWKNFHPDLEKVPLP
jgi:hypothetical protein